MDKSEIINDIRDKLEMANCNVDWLLQAMFNYYSDKSLEGFNNFINSELGID